MLLRGLADRGAMKRVTVLIPDTVVTVFDSSSPGFARIERRGVTQAPIVRALTTNDYHEHVYFESDVQVVSIEDLSMGG